MKVDIQYEEYEAYLKEHYKNVRKGYFWIKRSVPEILDMMPDYDFDFLFLVHDDTKTIPWEYEGYYRWIFSKKKTKEIEKQYRLAQMEHHHNNPHHWQHWLVYDLDKGIIANEIPYQYLVEMVCNWWSYSWADDDLFSIFDYYKKNKKKMILHDKSRKKLEWILRTLEEGIIRVRGKRKK